MTRAMRPARLVGDAGRDHAAIGMADQGDVLQVLELEHRRHVVDVRGEVDLLVGEVGALAQPRVGRREEFMAGGARTAAASSSRPRRLTTHRVPERSLPWRFPLEAGGARNREMLLRITRNDIQTNHSTGRRTRGLSWPHPRACHERRRHRPARAELERRLIELGFVEGADVELLHQGLFGGDPIAVRVAATHHCAAPPRGHGDPGDGAADRCRERRRPTRAGRRAGRQSQLRQDRAVQRPDRQPPEGRQLSRRHRREEGGRAAHAGRPRRSRWSTCPAPIPCAPAAPTRRSPATWCWAACRARSPPDLMVCVADASNLRLVLRLALELKRVGRPMVLALNMIDIAAQARHRDRPRAPVARAGRAGRDNGGGAPRRHRRAAGRDRPRCSTRLPAAATADWRAPDAGEMRVAPARGRAHAARRACAGPGGPTRCTARSTRVLLHPVAGLVVLLALLFVMFQAVFAWARPADGR